MNVESSVIAALKMINLPNTITPILSDRDGVEPPAPYLLINLINTNNISTPQILRYHKDGDIKETIRQTKEFYVSLTFHASATDPVQNWIQSFYTALGWSDQVNHAFASNGLSVIRSTNLNYSPDPVDGKNYKNSVIDMTLRAEVTESFDVNALTRVEIEGSFQDNSSDYKAQVNIDVEQ